MRGVFEGIGANGEGGFCVVDLTQFLGVFKAVTIEPAFNDPMGMRLGNREVFDGLFLSIGIGDWFPIFGDATQNGIDQFADVYALGFVRD